MEDAINKSAPAEYVSDIEQNIEGLNDEVELRTTGIKRIVHQTKRALQMAAIVAELAPTNEAIRFGAFGAAQAISGDPLAGAAALGGSTLVVEGSAAVATADLLTTEKGNKAIEKVKEKIDKHISPDAKLSPLGEAGLAMLGGSAVVTLAKQIEDPSRTKEASRRHGLFTSTWMAGYFAVEGALISSGINNIHQPEAVGAAALGLASLTAASHYATKRIKKRKGRGAESGMKESRSDARIEKFNLRDIREGHDLNEEQIEQGKKLYRSFRDRDDEALRIGLFGEDLEKAMKDPETTMLVYETESKHTAHIPILIPTNKLEWYNNEFLTRLYGQDAPILYYSHPPIPTDERAEEMIREKIREKLNRGAIVISEKYDGKNGMLDKLLNSLDSDYVVEAPHIDGHESRVDTFIGEAKFNGVDNVKQAPSFYEVYQREVQAGSLESDSEDGVSVVESIEGQDAERLWEIYENPFDELGINHPTLAGFDKKTFQEILKDPAVTKIVNKVDGKISTLCIFVQDFDQCPWFNASYYRDNYPEYFETSNIFIFPGIVSDENMRGNNYASDVIKLAIELFSKRDTYGILTFECTEISSQYVPKIVKSSFEAGGMAKVNGLESPVSKIEYVALKKAN